MTTLRIELHGQSSAAIDVVASELLEFLSNADVEVRPTPSNGIRDGGVIALTIAVLGGLASLAQIAQFIHSLLQKKVPSGNDVTIIVISKNGEKMSISTQEDAESIRGRLQKIVYESNS